jgi:hypothetical protein
VALSKKLIILASQLELKQDEASQRRAISTAYYAVFHKLAETITSAILGYDQPSIGTSLAKEWVRVYRSIDHKSLRDALRQFAIAEQQKKVPKERTVIEGISSSFSKLQDNRNNADYDPHFDVISAEISRTALDEAVYLVTSIEDFFDNQRSREFAIEVLLKNKTKR